jgi:hypothetical protein
VSFLSFFELVELFVLIFFIIADYVFKSVKKKPAQKRKQRVSGSQIGVAVVEDKVKVEEIKNNVLAVEAYQ